MQPLENKFARLANLPAMPVLLMDALDQLNGKQDLSTLVDKISQDPTMVIRLLRIANSPFYGMSREIGSLREAIVLLGFDRIRDMLISICFSAMLVAGHKDFDFRQHWLHSVAVAECARQLADLSASDPDCAFTAGLLHDIGFFVIAVLFPDEFSRIISQPAPLTLEKERSILGFDHVEMGSKAAQYWNLPIAIQEAIEQHETPLATDSAASLGLLVYAANLLIVRTKQSDQPTPQEYQPLYVALTLINISLDEATKCAERGLQLANQIGTVS